MRWPDGRVTTVPAARANRLYEVRQAAARASVPTPADTIGPLFEDATARLGGHAHDETPFDDFRRQPLLPTRLSQLGPGLAWLDVDADGDDDLVVGAGRGGALTLLRNDGASFRSSPLTDAVVGDLTAIVPVPDGRGGVRLAVGHERA